MHRLVVSVHEYQKYSSATCFPLHVVFNPHHVKRRYSVSHDGVRLEWAGLLLSVPGVLDHRMNHEDGGNNLGVHAYVFTSCFFVFILN